MNFFSRIKSISENEVALNSAWQFFERLLSLGCSFISSIFIIRYFAPADYGIFAYSSSYVTLFSSITSLGMQSIVVREFVKKDIPAEIIMGSSYLIMLIGAIVALSLAVFGALISHESKLVISVILIYCTVNVINSLAILNYFFQANLKTRYIAYVLIFQDVIDIIIRLSFVYGKAHLISFAILGLIEALLSNLVIFIIFRIKFETKIWKFDFKVARYLLQQSIPLALAGVLVNLYMRLDQVMIEYYKGLKAVAEYNVGVKLIEIFYFIPMIIVPNIFPVIVKVFYESVDKFENKIIEIYKYTIYGSVLIALIICIFGGYFVTLLYGGKYLASEKIFEIGIWCIVPVYIGIFSSLWNQTLSLQKYSLFTTFCGLVTCVLLNFILIPKYGIIGAIIATIIAQFVSGVFAQLLIKKTRRNFMLIIKSIYKF